MHGSPLPNCKIHGLYVWGSDIVYQVYQMICRYMFTGMSWYPYLFQIMTIDCTISWHGFSDAERERYLNCDVYTHSADIPTQNTICHRHFTQRKFYCRTWQCETPRCPLRRQIPRAGDCSYCPSKSINFTIRIPVHIVLVI